MLEWLARRQPTVIVDEDGVRERHFSGSRSVSWQDVTRIAGQRVDRLTYEENFLILYGKDHAWVTIGELDPDFHAAEAIIARRFPDFPADWSARLESGPGATSYQVLWSNDDGPGAS